jgi:hypothetical protein
LKQHPALSWSLAPLAALEAPWWHRFSLLGTALRRLIMMPRA